MAKNSVPVDFSIKGAITLQDKMFFLAITTILALVFRPTPSASQEDNTVTALPLTRALPESLTPVNKSALQLRCEKWYEVRSTRTFIILYATPLYQPFVVVKLWPAQ